MTSSATRSPSVGQLDALVGHVADQPQLAELLDHPRRRRGRDAEALGERVRRHRLPLRCCDRVDRLGVVLDGLADVRSARRHHALTSSPVAYITSMPPAMPPATARSRIRPAASRSPGRAGRSPGRSRRRRRRAGRRRATALKAAAPIHAPSTAGPPASSPSTREAADRGARARCAERGDDRQALGRVVDREADDEERAERERSGRRRPSRWRGPRRGCAGRCRAPRAPARRCGDAPAAPASARARRRTPTRRPGRR